VWGPPSPVRGERNCYSASKSPEKKRRKRKRKTRKNLLSPPPSPLLSPKRKDAESGE